MHTRKGREVVYTREKILVPRQPKIYAKKVTLFVTDH